MQSGGTRRPGRSSPERFLSCGHTRKSLPPGLPAGCPDQHGCAQPALLGHTCSVLQGRICVRGQLAGPGSPVSSHGLRVGSLDARQVVWWGRGARSRAHPVRRPRRRLAPPGNRLSQAPGRWVPERKQRPWSPSQGAGGEVRPRCEEWVWMPLRFQGIFPAVGVHVPPPGWAVVWQQLGAVRVLSPRIKEEAPFLCVLRVPYGLLCS